MIDKCGERLYRLCRALPDPSRIFSADHRRQLVHRDVDLVLDHGRTGKTAPVKWLPAIHNEYFQAAIGKRQSHQCPADTGTDDQDIDAGVRDLVQSRNPDVRCVRPQWFGGPEFALACECFQAQCLPGRRRKTAPSRNGLALEVVKVPFRRAIAPASGSSTGMKSWQAISRCLAGAGDHRVKCTDTRRRDEAQGEAMPRILALS